MPINLSAASSPEPDPQTPGTGEEIAQDVQPKRKRRTKEELIADAVVPGDDDKVELKESGTGAKIERPWLVAVEMVKDGKAEWVDKSMKYTLLKYEQQKVAQAFTEPSAPTTDAFGRPSPEQLEAAQLPTDVSGQMVAPPGSEHGDEVRIGTETYRVGPGGTLVKGVVDAPTKRRWQRELGAGADGPWESVVVGSSQNGSGEPAFASTYEAGNEILDTKALGDAANEADALDVQTERLPRTVEPLDDGTVKIGTGILEKIGLPDYSSFQVGPLTMSRTVLDDGRRTSVTFDDGRVGEVITSAVEGFELLDNTVEFVAARFRGQLLSFLQSIGAAKQPVS